MGEFPSSHMPPQLLTQPFTLSLSPPQSIPHDFIHSHLSHTPFLQSTILFFSCCKPSAFSLLSASLLMLLPHSSPPLLLPSISCFLSIPPLISQHPSLLGPLAMVWCCWQSVGAGGTQTGAQMGSKLCGAARHTCSIHTNTHIQSRMLPPHHTACLAQFYRDTDTNIQRQSRMYTYIRAYVHRMNVCT